MQTVEIVNRDPIHVGGKLPQPFETCIEVRKMCQDVRYKKCIESLQHGDDDDV
jgi:hypothetical protein